MLREIHKLWRKFLKPKEDVDYNLRSGKEPLHPNILAKSFPKNFRVPRVELYKGKTDPNDPKTDPNDHINILICPDGGHWKYQKLF